MSTIPQRIMQREERLEFSFFAIKICDSSFEMFIIEKEEIFGQS